MTVQDVVQLQEMLNVNPDGKWGKQSQAAFESLMWQSDIGETDSNMSFKLTEREQARKKETEEKVSKVLAKICNIPAVKSAISFIEKHPPKKGVLGICLTAEIGFGVDVGVQVCVAIDSSGKMVLFRTRITGGGFGVGAGGSFFEIPDAMSVNELDGTGLGINMGVLAVTGGMVSTSTDAGYSIGSAGSNVKLGFSGYMTETLWIVPIN